MHARKSIPTAGLAVRPPRKCFKFPLAPLLTASMRPLFRVNCEILEGAQFSLFLPHEKERHCGERRSSPAATLRASIETSCAGRSPSIVCRLIVILVQMTNCWPENRRKDCRGGAYATDIGR